MARSIGKKQGARLATRAAALVLLALAPAAAQEEVVGPCSPYRAADGDIPSEMPGCSRRLRAAPGSLADEMEFQRARERNDADADPGDDEGSRVRRRGARPRHPLSP